MQHKFQTQSSMRSWSSLIGGSLGGKIGRAYADDRQSDAKPTLYKRFKWLVVISEP
jgi:hypothetical protein